MVQLIRPGTLVRQIENIFINRVIGGSVMLVVEVIRDSCHRDPDLHSQVITLYDGQLLQWNVSELMIVR